MAKLMSRQATTGPTGYPFTKTRLTHAMIEPVTVNAPIAMINILQCYDRIKYCDK